MLERLFGIPCYFQQWVWLLKSSINNHVTMNRSWWLTRGSCLEGYWSYSAYLQELQTRSWQWLSCLLEIWLFIRCVLRDDCVYQPGLGSKEKEQLQISRPDRLYSIHLVYSYNYTPFFFFIRTDRRQFAAPAHHQGRPTGTERLHADQMPFLKPMQSQQK